MYISVAVVWPDNFNLFELYKDISSRSNPSWLEKIQQTVRNILKAVNLFKTPVDKSGANQGPRFFSSCNK